jgi:8-oxo-dGTP pyrophosphatase MutT (NUDIX family)
VTFDETLEHLEAGLARPLPGAAAHRLLAPRPRGTWPRGFNEARVRHAAGLLLIFPVHNRAHVVLTERAATLGRHGGQVSLPGGASEPGETFEQTALREAREEVALAADGIRVLGALTPLDIPVSGFRLHPVVACVNRRPPMRPADGEVARILEVAIDELIQPLSLRTQETFRDGTVSIVPGFHVHGLDIWGATAMVLAEFLILLGWQPNFPP